MAASLGLRDAACSTPRAAAGAAADAHGELLPQGEAACCVCRLSLLLLSPHIIWTSNRCSVGLVCANSTKRSRMWCVLQQLQAHSAVLRSYCMVAANWVQAVPYGPLGRSTAAAVQHLPVLFAATFTAAAISRATALALCYPCVSCCAPRRVRCGAAWTCTSSQMWCWGLRHSWWDLYASHPCNTNASSRGLWQPARGNSCAPCCLICTWHATRRP